MSNARMTALKNLWFNAQSIEAKSLFDLCSKAWTMFRSTFLIDCESFRIEKYSELLRTKGYKKWAWRIVCDDNFETFVESKFDKIFVNYSRIVNKKSKRSKTSKKRDESDVQNKKKNEKKKEICELKFSKHRSLHVFDWTRHRTRKLKQTNLIDWQNRDSFVDDRLQIIEENTWWNYLTRFLIFDDRNSWLNLLFSRITERKVDAIIW
jgi:hypothetical protein